MKQPLLVIHCHGCGLGVLVQFSHDCPKCGFLNATGQSIGSDYRCMGCDKEVSELTASADSEIQRRVTA